MIFTLASIRDPPYNSRDLINTLSFVGFYSEDFEHFGVELVDCLYNTFWSLKFGLLVAITQNTKLSWSALGSTMHLITPRTNTKPRRIIKPVPVIIGEGEIYKICNFNIFIEYIIFFSTISITILHCYLHWFSLQIKEQLLRHWSNES